MFVKHPGNAEFYPVFICVYFALILSICVLDSFIDVGKHNILNGGTACDYVYVRDHKNGLTSTFKVKGIRCFSALLLSEKYVSTTLEKQSSQKAILRQQSILKAKFLALLLATDPFMNTCRKLLLPLAIFALITCHVFADTIVLKSGTKYKGKVISEDTESYLVEIHYSKTIKDERRIPKADVKEIIKDAKDAAAIEKVRTTVPVPSLLPARAYDTRIVLANDFLAKFPGSKHTKEVQKILATLKKEQTVIKNGGLKIEGQLITASDVEANAYDIHARILLIEMKQLAAQGRNLPAMRKWETLKIEYPHAQAYANSITLANRTVNAYRTELTQLLNTLETRKTKRKSTLESLNQGDRQRTLDLLQKKSSKHEALVQKEERELRLRWLTTDPFHKKSLEYNKRSCEATTNILRNFKPSGFRPAGPDYRAAWSSLANGNLEMAQEHINKLKSFRIPEKYTHSLTRTLAAKKADAELEKARKEKEAQATKEAAEKAKQKDTTKEKPEQPKVK